MFIKDGYSWGSIWIFKRKIFLDFKSIKDYCCMERLFIWINSRRNCFWIVKGWVREYIF